jgi:hypothetical protein
MLAQLLRATLAFVLVASIAAAQETPGHSPVSRSAASTSGAQSSSGAPRAQDEPASEGPVKHEVVRGIAQQPPPEPTKTIPVPRWHEPIEILFSLGVLAFGATLIVLFTRTLLKLGSEWRTIYLRLVVLTVVVTAGLFALAAGYTEQQIAPMMGLLGTLVGYLLGRDSNSAPAPDPGPPAARK